MLDGLKRRFAGSRQAAPDVPVMPMPDPKVELVKQLDLLADLLAREANLTKPFDERLERIQAEMRVAVGDLPDKINRVEKKCKDLGMQVGGNVFGSTLKAEFVHGRENVDVKALKGWSVDHPEVKQFITQSSPTCRIKAISDKEQKLLTLTTPN